MSDDFEVRLCACRPGLVRFALRYYHDRAAAEDLAHDTIVKALQARHQFDGRNLTAWLMRIMVNHHHQLHRRVVRDVRMREVMLAADTSCRGADVCEVEVVLAALQSLIPSYRNCLLSVAEHGDYAMVAAELRLARGTVKSRISRARDALEAKLKWPTSEAA